MMANMIKLKKIPIERDSLKYLNDDSFTPFMNSKPKKLKLDYLLKDNLPKNPKKNKLDYWSQSSYPEISRELHVIHQSGRIKDNFVKKKNITMVSLQNISPKKKNKTKTFLSKEINAGFNNTTKDIFISDINPNYTTYENSRVIEMSEQISEKYLDSQPNLKNSRNPFIQIQKKSFSSPKGSSNIIFDKSQMNFYVGKPSNNTFHKNQMFIDKANSSLNLKSNERSKSIHSNHFTNHANNPRPSPRQNSFEKLQEINLEDLEDSVFKQSTHENFEKRKLFESKKQNQKISLSEKSEHDSVNITENMTSILQNKTDYFESPLLKNSEFFNEKNNFVASKLDQLKVIPKINNSFSDSSDEYMNPFCKDNIISAPKRKSVRYENIKLFENDLELPINVKKRRKTVNEMTSLVTQSQKMPFNIREFCTNTYNNKVNSSKKFKKPKNKSVDKITSKSFKKESNSNIHNKKKKIKENITITSEKDKSKKINKFRRKKKENTNLDDNTHSQNKSKTKSQNIKNSKNHVQITESLVFKNKKDKKNNDKFKLKNLHDENKKKSSQFIDKNLYKSPNNLKKTIKNNSSQKIHKRTFSDLKEVNLSKKFSKTSLANHQILFDKQNNKFKHKLNEDSVNIYQSEAPFSHSKKLPFKQAFHNKLESAINSNDFLGFTKESGSTKDKYNIYLTTPNKESDNKIYYFDKQKKNKKKKTKNKKKKTEEIQITEKSLKMVKTSKSFKQKNLKGKK